MIAGLVGRLFGGLKEAGVGTARLFRKDPNRFQYLTRRIIPAGVAIGGTQLAAYALEKRAEERRAFYGEGTYSARYGTSAETAASLVRGTGMAVGFGSLLGITPSVRRTVSNLTAPGQFGATAKRLGKKAFKAGAIIGGPALLLGPVAADPVGTTAIGAGITTAAVAALMPKTTFKIIKKIAPTTTLVGASAAAGAAVGTRMEPAAAEGRITSFEAGGSGQRQKSVVSRLNYSTAGMLQSIHNNRKVL